MSSGAKVNSQAVADMITALVTMQNKMMAMENNLELGMTTAGAKWKDDQFKKLQEMLRDDSNIMVKKSRYGIGLRNTNRRIKLLYGSDYGLTIESEVEERTCVTITFPKHRP